MAQAAGPFSSEVVVDELDDEIFVRVLVCCYEPNDEDEFMREYIDCPVRVWLDAPIGGTNGGAAIRAASMRLTLPAGGSQRDTLQAELRALKARFN